MSELITIEPVWQIKDWLMKPIFEKGQVAYIEDIGTCLFLEDCWVPMADAGFGDKAFAKVEVLSANDWGIEGRVAFVCADSELQECAG